MSYLDYELKEAYDTSFLSEIYLGIALSKNTVSKFLNDLGKTRHSTCHRVLESILEAFQPFYQETTLGEEINVDLIYRTQKELRTFNVYDDDDVEKLFDAYSKNNSQNARQAQCSAVLKVLLTYTMEWIRRTDISSEGKSEHL